MKRVYNFYSGPATLPLSILEKAAGELTDYNNTGMSIIENSHRSKTYEAVHNDAINNIKSLLKVPENYEVLLLQGGASSQFYMIPMNLLQGDEIADFIVTGSWSEKAVKEAKIQNKKINIVASSEKSNFNTIPSDLKFTKNAKYVYFVSNETIQGVQFKKFPETNGIPKIIDASSDIFSYPIDWKDVGLLFAGAQKNAGPSGLVIVIIRKDLIEDRNPNIPTMLRYSTHAKENSLYNTPSSFAVYLMSLNLQWLKSQGGIDGIQKINEKKAAYIYDAIDSSNGFYIGHAEKAYRSLMNITFRFNNEELENAFVKEAEALDLIGLKGHRSVGGMRASVYNAMPIEGCEILGNLMKEFMKKNK